jgi:hypothetical protein
MTTIEKRQLTANKVAHIQTNRDGELYVAIEQTYPHPDVETMSSESTWVLDAKAYKTMRGVEKFIQKWAV